MKVGIVCEGPTDFLAIKHYVGAALEKNGITVQFVAVQPTPDNTSGGGWGNVFTWLENNPPKAREQFFGRGLFAHSKALSGFDALVIHLDTDILPEPSFINFLTGRNYQLGSSGTLKQKSAEIARLITHFANLQDCLPEHSVKHIAAPIAESSEAWCVAADKSFDGDAESLRGQDLMNAFGATYARFGRHPVKASYASINKKTKSRDNYCKATSEDIERLQACTQFVALVDNLLKLRPIAP